MREALGFIKVQRLTVKTRVLGIFQVSVNVSQNRGSFTCSHEKVHNLRSPTLDWDCNIFACSTLAW